MDDLWELMGCCLALQPTTQRWILVIFIFQGARRRKNPVQTPPYDAPHAHVRSRCCSVPTAIPHMGKQE